MQADERKDGSTHNYVSPTEPYEVREDTTEEGFAVVESQTSWERVMTPRIVLVVFTALNFITYYDRGVMAGCLAVIKEDSNISGESRTLSDTRSGFLISGFMIGFMTTSPIFAAFGGIVPSKWMIVGGMVAWGIFCVGTGLAKSYTFLLICRIIVGVGEAAFVGFTVTIIDRIAPHDSRTLWIGTFYSMIPVGSAVGMGLGGVISSVGAIGSLEGWRVAFLSEVVAAIPIVLLIALLPSNYNLRLASDEAEYLPIHKATAKLLTNVKYVLTVLGYAMYCFVVGAVSVWAIPMLVQGPMQLSNLTSALIMGGVTALTGVFGCVVGGVAVDKLGGSRGRLGAMKCHLFDTVMMVISVPLGLVALFMTTIWLFIPILVISVFALFAVTAPVNAAILTVVPSELKPYAVSYSVFFIHLLGDFPSPTFAGYLSDNCFSQGCPNYNYDSCIADTLNQCRWINSTTEGSSGHCVNEFQLRNSLLIVFSMLAFSIPCWLAVYYFLLREHKRSLSGLADTEVSLTTEEREYDNQSPRSNDVGKNAGE